MEAVLVVLAVVLFLAIVWLGGIMIDRKLRRHWEQRMEAHYAALHEGVDPFGPEDAV
jgi:hypothetical protein